MNTRIRAAALAAAASVALVLSGCSGGAGSGTDPGDVDPEGEITPREISWLLSRPADGGVITAMQQIADEYAADHPGFSLNLITTPDRPSYIQKYETLAAANKLPELFDTDATPFAQKLADQGRMIDVEKLLESLGLLRRLPARSAELPALRRRVAVHDAVRVPAGVLLVQHGHLRAGRRRRARDARRLPGDVRGAARGGRHAHRARRPGPVAARALHGLLPVPHSPVPSTCRS